MKSLKNAIARILLGAFVVIVVAAILSMKYAVLAIFGIIALALCYGLGAFLIHVAKTRQYWW